MLINKNRLLDVLRAERLDAIVGTSPENVLYLGNYWAMSQWVRRGPQAYALVAADNQQPVVVTNSALLDLVADQNIAADIRRYSYFKTDFDDSAQLSAADLRQKKLFETEAYKGPIEALAAAIRDRGLSRARIGIDEIGITPQCMEQLAGEFPDVDRKSVV